MPMNISHQQADNKKKKKSFIVHYKNWGSKSKTLFHKNIPRQILDATEWEKESHQIKI